MTKRHLNLVLYPTAICTIVLVYLAKFGIVQPTWKVWALLIALTLICLACGMYKDVLDRREKLNDIYE